MCRKSSTDPSPHVERILHAIYFIRKQQIWPKIRYPFRSVTLHLHLRRGRFQAHSARRIVIDGHLIDARKLAVEFNGRNHILRVAGEHVVHDIHTGNLPSNRFQNNVAVSEEEAVRDRDLERILNDYAVVIHVRANNSVLCRFYQNAHAAEVRGLVVAMDAGHYVGPSPQQDPYCGREDNDVGYGVVGAGDVDGGAGVVPLVSVPSDGRVLPEEAAGHEDLVSAYNKDPFGGEVEEETVGDSDSG